METFVDAFLRQTQICGTNPSVMDCRGADTYAALNRRSALLGRKILDTCKTRGIDVEERRKEGKNGARIAVLLPRTRNYMTAVLAVLRVGCALIPVDTSYPRERIEAILRDGESSLCVTTESLSEKVGSFPTLLMEDVFSTEKVQEADKTLNLSAPDIEGLLIFTSGSTGKPKGVLHRQSIFSHHLKLMEGIHHFTPQDVICCMAGFTFLAAELDLFTPLMTGGSLYIADENERQNADLLFSLIQKRHVTGMFLPPQMFTFMRELYGRLPLQYVLLGGEKAKTKYADDGNLYEVYGSSENFVAILHPLTHGDARLLGKPSAGARAYLLDEDGSLITEPDRIGELCIVSPWTAEGYIGLPQETAERFVPCPFEAGQRMYHTGDYMAWDKDGNLLFHGRKDRMVKLRGYRVELGEIENVLRKAPGIADAACVAVKVGGGDKLCCYYRGEKTDHAVLAAYAEQYLPGYMVPNYTVWMEQFPLNERQKVNYLALAAMEPPVDEGKYIAPENETERAVCEAFATALDMQRVSATADFFELGGTSLSVAVLIARLSNQRPGLSFQDVTRHPTPRTLAAFLMETPSQNQGTPETDRDFYPLTKTQMGIYLEALTGGSSATYTVPYLMQASPDLTAEQLIAAVKAVVAAHPSMKYVIRGGADGIPHMFMVPDAQVDIQVVDGKAEERLEFMRRFMPVVPMMDGLLFHFAVYRTRERCYLALKSHLIFLDGTSISLMIAELNRALAGKPLLAEKYTIQQVGMREEQKMRDGTHETAKQYHADLFKGMEDIPPLMGDREGKLTPGVSENLRYEPGTLTTERVKSFCSKNQITESSFFLGAMALMLGKYLNSERISFSTVYNGRAQSGLETTIGTLIKRIPVYGDLARDLPVGDYLRAISRQVLSTMSNDIYSFDEVLKDCPVNEDVEFIYQGDLFTDSMGASAGETLIEGDKWFMEHYHTGMVTGCFSIQFFATQGFYNMTLEYRNERFSPAFATRFAENLFTIAEGLLTKNHIGEVEMLTDADRQTLARFNDTAVPMDFMPVHEQIHRHALQTPEKTAVTAAGKTLTFRELDALSNQLAACLRERGVKPETLVGVLLDREVWAYVAEIGILKAGGAFVPFIPDYPDERIDFCMKDGSIPYLVTTEAQQKKRAGIMGESYRLLTLEELFGVKTLNDIQASETYIEGPKMEIRPDNLAYCIYTSGTTGRPKGVMIEHHNIANYVHRNEKSLEIMHYAEAGRVCLALASFSFDVSVVEEFVPLCNGNGVVIATEEEIHTPDLLAKLILENNVTGITCTPTYLLSLLDIPAARDAIARLTFFDIGAEAFPARLYDRLRELRKDSVILNVYGPTEATMGCAAEEMTSSYVVTVGPPIANTVFAVVDSFGNDLPVGIRGQLVICGSQVGRGYINLPDKTAASFFTRGGLRAYRSGDLAAWTPDGKIRIFGRTDNQIKLRGFRIELDEIEKVMNEYPGVKTGVAAVRKDGGTEYLVGYYTAQETISADRMKQYIQDKLPEYMVPHVLMQLDAISMTSSGKADKKALPQPDFSSFKAAYTAPETDAEKAICQAFARALRQEERNIGALDDFFDLGGDSLRAMTVLAEANLDGLTAADVFQKRTPRAIAAAVEARARRESLDARDERARKMTHPLTPMQVEMMDYQLFRPGSTMWSTTHFLARFGQEIDPERLCAAVNKALQNHPGLSVAFFFNEDNELRQQYVPGLLKEIKVQRIRPEVEAMLSDVLVNPFHQVLNACLCRVNVMQGSDCCYLFMDVHHLLMDGASLGVLLGDITNAYFGKELKKDYYFALLAEQNERLAAGEMEKDRAYFHERYGDEIWCNIVPPDHESKNIGQASLPHRLSFTAEQVKAAEEYWGVSHSVMAIAAGLKALSQFTGKNHVMLNWIFNNRLSPESENVVGLLIKNLPAAVRMEEISCDRELLLSVKEQVAEGITHCGWDYMVETLRPFENDCMEVNLQLGINGDELDPLHPEQLPLNNEFAAAGARLELELIENEYGDGAFDHDLDYAEGLFDRERMEAFHQMYVEILEAFIQQGSAATESVGC